MSEEMAVGDNANPEKAVLDGAKAAAASVIDVEPTPDSVEEPPSVTGSQQFSVECQVEREGDEPEPPEPASIAEPNATTSEAPVPDVPATEVPVTEVPVTEVPVTEVPVTEVPAPDIPVPDTPASDDKRGVKRRASSAFINEEKVEVDEFRGFEPVDQNVPLSMDYSKVLERLESEVEAVKKTYTPLKFISANITAMKPPSKRARQDTSSSRPSSGLSIRSDGESIFSNEASNSSPANRGRRTATVEMSSPLLRVPLERGWKRELVYRAALDPHQRRNADIYYYTPQGKKLRSTREVADYLPGTGLTAENFSFFKEPLGVDDPDKEIIRDAKPMRQGQSPIQSPAPVVVEGKRAPKPKAPKGASPIHLKSPPAKLKVKSMGSRLSGSGSGPSPAPKKKPGANNNNTATWKKPRPHPQHLDDGHQEQPPHLERHTPHQWQRSGQSRDLSEGSSDSEVAERPKTHALVQQHPPAPPPLQSRPAPVETSPQKATKQVVQTCSLTCGMGVPTLACRVCLCLYHPACAQYWDNQHLFTCKNCYSPSCPPSEPPPLIHKSGVPTAGSLPLPAPVPRRAPVPDQRVLLRMKVAGGGPDGERVWAVAKPNQTTKPTVPPSKPTVATPKPTAAPPNPTAAPPKPTAAPPKPTPVAPKHTPAPPKHTPAPPKPILAPPKLTPIPVKPSQPVNIPKLAQIPAQIAPKPIPVPGKVKKVQNIPKVVPIPSSALAMRPRLPQSLALLNGRRFIVVPRAMDHQPLAKPKQPEKKKGRMSNGATVATPNEALLSPRRRGRSDETDYFTPLLATASKNKYNVVVQIFQYLGMRDLAHVARVCRQWRELAASPQLWKHVRMKNSHVSDWGGLCTALKRHGTKRLDLRKLLLPSNDEAFWEQFAKHIATVNTLERIEMCRCPARAVEAVCHGLPNLRSLSAVAIRDALLDPSPLGNLPLLHELRLKSMSGLSLTRDLRPLAALKHLQHLSLTSIKDLGRCASDVVGQLENLESLELGECTFRAEFATVLSKLHKLRRLRLERGTAQCAAPALLRALAGLPLLTRLELVNIDIKVGFDDALAECKNIQRLLIIPTYVSQSATTNRQVLSGVLRLKDTLTHLMWGVTIELLRVTELFIDQCEGGDRTHKDMGECIPVLKPVPGCKLPTEHQHVQSPPQVEILPLPVLQRLLAAQLPTTKLKLLRIPFHATWRQSLADFQ